MHDRIHVVQLIKNFSIESGGGGIERFGISLAQSLDPNKFQASVCGLWDTGTTFERERKQQLTINGVNSFTLAAWDPTRPYQTFLHAVKGLREWLMNNPVDILHSHSEFSDMAVLPYGLHRKPAILRTIHNREWRKRPFRKILLTHLLFPILFRQEIGVSMAIVRQLNSRPIARICHKRAKCLYNAVDLGRFLNPKSDRIKKRHELGLPIGSNVIGSVGRLTYQKGYTFLVEAAKLVIQNIPNTSFVIVGAGEELETLMNQANKLGVNDKVIFTGPRQDIEEILPVFDLFVSSSLWEGLPTVIMESMAAGVPVVATDIPGTRELAVNNAINWLAEPGNVKNLAEVIIAAMRNPTQREMSVNSAREVVQSFSIQAVADEHAALYSSIVRKD